MRGDEEHIVGNRQDLTETMRRDLEVASTEPHRARRSKIDERIRVGCNMYLLVLTGTATFRERLQFQQTHVVFISSVEAIENAI